MFYFIRHGETDYSNKNQLIYQGFGVHLCPLSKKGIEQIKEAAKDPRLQDADVILSSPYTRALQTAAILSKELGIDIIVETNLHEWLANKNYVYEHDDQAKIQYVDYHEHHGIYPEGIDKTWESEELMEKRVLEVLKHYKHHKKIIVACHGMLIKAVTKKHYPQNGEIIEFE